MTRNAARDSIRLDARIFACARALAIVRLRLARNLLRQAQRAIRGAHEAMAQAEDAARRMAPHLEACDEFDRETMRIIERMEARDAAFGG